MECSAPACLAVAVVMAGCLLCVNVRAAALVVEPPPAALLAQAENAKAINPARFRSTLAQLHQHGERLTAEQRWHLRLLDAWLPSFEGDFGKADRMLYDVMDHSGSRSLSTRAMALLVQDKFLSHQYVEAYALANTLMAELPKVTDPVARMEGMSRVITMLNMSVVGQYDLALQFARQMKTRFPSGVGQCHADMLEVKSLLYAGKLAATDPRFQRSIDECLAVGQLLTVSSLRLDQASEMIDEGHADQAIALLHRIAPEVKKTHYPPYLASLPVTLARHI